MQTRLRPLVIELMSWSLCDHGFATTGLRSRQLSRLVEQRALSLLASRGWDLVYPAPEDFAWGLDVCAAACVIWPGRAAAPLLNCAAAELPSFAPRYRRLRRPRSRVASLCGTRWLPSGTKWHLCRATAGTEGPAAAGTEGPAGPLVTRP